MANPQGNTPKPKKSGKKIAIIIGLVIVFGAYFVQSSPSRYDTKTESYLEYMRKQIGNYVTAHRSMPMIDQLNLSADTKEQLAKRGYTLEFVADHSSRGTFFQEPTLDYKQCANFKTSTTDQPGDTNGTKVGFHLHHKGKHCFIDYAALKKNVFKP